ncbi:MAG: glycosyltransferase family 39 protein [Bacteroidota bacterium]|nr:glycosyltransferase family 39 protein [Bacteroidota bacterium]
MLWLLITSINLNKAFHIDDTFHIEVAKWIENNPLEPMSGKVNWGNNPNYISSFNQPPLFFYIMAFWGHFCGYSEVSLHLLLSIFTLISMIYFYKIIGHYTSKNSLLYLSLFALSPTLIINQNIMTDIPLLSMMLVFFYFIISNPTKVSNLIYASIFLGITLLIKYTTLPLFLVLIYAILKKYSWKNLSIILIPIGFLVLWSLFNWFEYQSIHFFDRPKNEFSLIRIFGLSFIFICCLGSLFPFLLTFVDKGLKIKFYAWIFIISIISIGFLTYFNLINQIQSDYTLYGLFAVNGILSVIAIIKLMRYLIKDYLFQLLFIALISLSVFMIILAPFMASRHFLLLLPFLILLAIPILEKSSPLTKNFILTISVIFGITTSISDWIFADFYRNKAAVFANKYPNSYSIGHWGWQHYSKSAGMQVYGRDSSRLKLGDILIGPVDVAKQAIHPSLVFDTIEQFVEPAPILTFISGKKHGSMYNASSKKTSWNFSHQPIDTILVYRVVKTDVKPD